MDDIQKHILGIFTDREFVPAVCVDLRMLNIAAQQYHAHEWGVQCAIFLEFRGNVSMAFLLIYMCAIIDFSLIFLAQFSFDSSSQYSLLFQEFVVFLDTLIDRL